MKNEIYLKGVEVLSSTEQVFVFAKIISKKEIGCAITVNMTLYESKDENYWTIADLGIEKTISELKKYKKVN